MHVSALNMGRIDIHGEPRLRTWTKLNETAYAGTNYFITSDPVDWRSGDKLVITGTVQSVSGDGYHSEGYQLEEITVDYLGEDQHHVYLTQNFVFTHWSEFPVVEGRPIDLRCAVGLLNRNIKIQGDDRSDGQQYGVHTFTMGSEYRIENAEITRCGQSYNTGRYCTHSHHSGNLEGSYVKANSIHHSYQRAVTTHDTQHWEVRDNVAFDITGHAYFIEDGTELYNSLSGNLGIWIKPSSALLKSDQEPAVFWTANPTNFWSDNYAAHSFKFGYWFQLDGASTVTVGTTNVCPMYSPLGEFFNNTARGVMDVGFRIYPQWSPLVDPCDGNSRTAPQYLYNTVSFHNGRGSFNGFTVLILQ